MTTQIIVIQTEQGHTQNTDTYLDYGGANQVAASAVKAVIDAKDTDGTLAANSDAKYTTQKAIKTYITTIAAGKISTTALDTDTALTANSDAKIPSQKAIKAYADAISAAKIATTYLDTDGTLAASSDSKLATQKATKTYADTKIASSYLDTDGTLAANSDTKVATQKAVKTYANLRIPLTYIDTDVTLAADSDVKIASQKATKTYIDTRSKRSVVLIVVDYTDDCSTGNGKVYFRIPDILNTMILSAVAACCITAGTTGTMDIQIRNVTKVVDMLTTKITIDSGETDSATAATPAVIDTTNDDVATADLIAIDVDAIHTTPAQGLLVSLTFEAA